MEMKLIRDRFTERSTGGMLYINGVFECFTLEDRDRHLETGGAKVPGETAIPRGSYDVQITMSARFAKPLPLLLNVPNYSGVRIHPGNKPEDTEGCILVGNGRDLKNKDWVSASAAAFAALFEKIERAQGHSELVTITIE